MESFANGAMQLELKYCERCGALWLRPQGSELIFCARCAKAMAGLVPFWSGETRMESAHSATDPGEEVSGFWGEGGNA